MTSFSLNITAHVYNQQKFEEMSYLAGYYTKTYIFV